MPLTRVHEIHSQVAKAVFLVECKVLAALVSSKLVLIMKIYI